MPLPRLRSLWPGLALWAYLSGTWGGSPARAALEADRVVLYLAMLLLMASAGWSPAHVRLMVGGLAAAVVVVAVAALVSRLAPGTGSFPTGHRPDQLSYPVTYWNALGLLAGFGVILCFHLASSLREPVWVRAAGAASVPIVSSALLLTLSRGALWCAALGLAVSLLVSRPRGFVTASLAVIPFTSVALLGLAHGAIIGTTPAQIEAFGLGTQPAWILGFCAIAAGLARIACAPLDRTLAELRVDGERRRVLALSGAAVLVVVALVTGVVVQRTGIGTHAYNEFVSETEAVGEGSSRLGSLANNNRISKWNIALDEWQRHPFRGTGAGTFELSWQRERATDGHVREAHSLYAETLGELGLPGLLLLVATVATIVVGLAARSRGADRAGPAALLGVAVAWVVHAGVDWDWEMPVVTIWLFAAGGLALARPAGTSSSRAGSRALRARLCVAAACVLVALLLPVRVALSESALQRARADLAAGDCRAASGNARSALDLMASRWQADYVLGVCAVSQARWRAAERDMRAAIAADQHNWLPHYGTAIALMARGSGGVRELDTALNLNPNEPGLRELAEALRSRTPARRRNAARRTSLPLPEL